MRLTMLKVLLLGVVLAFGASAQPAGTGTGNPSLGFCGPGSAPAREKWGNAHRGPCLIAAKQARAADPGLVAHCRRFKEDRDGPQAAAPE
jgi:hypothetical protein